MCRYCSDVSVSCATMSACCCVWFSVHVMEQHLMFVHHYVQSAVHTESGIACENEALIRVRDCNCR